MKLLFCGTCGDVKRLISTTWRKCECGAGGGQYNEDGMTATIGGQARVFGVGNLFFDVLYPYLDDEGKRKMWQDHYGHQMGDCWWGEYEGDQQLFRIVSPNGPRLEIEMENVDDPAMVRIIVRDQRRYSIGKEGRKESVIVPRDASHFMVKQEKPKRKKEKSNG